MKSGKVKFRGLNKMKKIMFICHGNICRSTMAEFVMKDIVKKAGREVDYQIVSRATNTDELGSDIHHGTKKILREMNIPFTHRQATQLRKKDYEEYSLLIAMDQNNLRNMRRMLGEDKEHKISLLLDFAGENRDIADPWYTGDFETTYEDVKRGCEALFEQLEKL